MRYWIGLVFFAILLQSNGQPAFGLYGNAGLNRMGFLFDLGGQCEIKGHQMRAGVRIYGPNQVFETTLPVAQLGYRYNHPLFKTFNLLSGIQFSYGQEKKGEVRFRFLDPQVEIGGQWQLGRKLKLATIFSMGSAQIYANNPTTPLTEHFYFLNYEFKIGLAYCFGHNHP